MKTIPLTLISDNVELYGGVSESQLQAVYETVPFSSNRKVYRLDRTGGSLAILDETTSATSGTSNAWSPFGANVIPAGATLKVYDSTDSQWASNELTLATGSIADFKSTGWHRIDFGANANRKDWKPSYDPASAIPARKYIRFELNDGVDNDSFIVSCGTSDIVAVLINVTTAGSTSTASKLAEIRIVRRSEDIKYLDLTSQANGSETASYTPSSDMWIPVVGHTQYVGMGNIAYALDEYVFRKDGTGITWEVEASGSGSTWLDITGVFTSGNNFRQNGPSTTAATATETQDTWTPPSGWTKRSLGTLTMEDGTTVTTANLYWLRFTVTAVSSLDPQQTPVYRLRARQYGDSNTVGELETVAQTFKSATLYIRGQVSGSGARTLQFVNLTTGDTRTLTIPAAAKQGDFVVSDFDDLTLSAGQKFGIPLSTGGVTVSDALLTLET